VPDSSTTVLPADFLLRGPTPRDPAPLAARLAEQFRQQNREVLRLVGVDLQVRFDGTEVRLEVTSGTTVGAVPLRSPSSGRTEFGLIIRPRYDWPGLGVMLGEMGWKVLPSPLPLPNLPRSERKVPPWVLSAIVLGRLQALLASLQRRFEMTESVRPAPHGQVNWQRYATQQLTRGKFTEVPCHHADLGLDRHLQAVVHFALRQHRASLESQRQVQPFIVSLIAWTDRLLDRVRAVPPHPPTAPQMRGWMHGGLRSAVVQEGLEAIAWTVDERGLAGLSDLHGLPWSMSMEAFFEAWVESLFCQAARQTGGVIRVGRQRQTLMPIAWDPPYQGSQRFLLPDLILETPLGLVVVDAKYKVHWEELRVYRWSELEETVRERHRADLLQVLAYSSPLEASHLAVCLVYPCRRATWESLRERGRLFHRAALGSGGRVIHVLLTAVPMEGGPVQVVNALTGQLRQLVSS
jgi:hypothetical protein